jgi:hypothetical protein
MHARFPDIVDTEPEVLAHHLTEAGKADSAIPLWQKAGLLALKRAALTEAIGHLTKGLELVSTLPPSSERDASELTLRNMLGTTWVALKGWPASEVQTAFLPALPLAKSRGQPAALLPILQGVWVNVLTRGQVQESLSWVKELFDAAAVTDDSDIEIASHGAALNTYFWLGELVTARLHGEQMLLLYDEKKHRRVLDDPKTTLGICAAHWTWMLGYADQAVRISDDTSAHARRRGYPFGLGWALTLGAEPFDFRYEPEKLRTRAEECERLGREYRMPVLWAMLAPITSGVALIHGGQSVEGVPLLKAGLTEWEGTGGKLHNPYWKAVLAEGMAELGDRDGALQLIDEQIEDIERPACGERAHYSDILRLKATMLSLKGDLEGAEQIYLNSLAWARHQQAKSWELRTSTSLARLWQRQGKRRNAYELVSPVYGWFTEGFDTRDLLDAKALLKDLTR